MGYYTFTIPKRGGGTRLITAPDDELKAKQRTLLKKLQKEQWVSRRAHGFKKYSSCMTNADMHIGKKYVLNIDVKDFFPSIRQSAFRPNDNRNPDTGDYIPALLSMGYNLFASTGSLPQGAPTSPFISNLYMRRFDTQIQGLLRKFISDDIVYTRYADDLTFSSNSRALKKSIEIVRDKLKYLRLEINDAKTRFMAPGQRQEITGININSGRPTIPKVYRRKVRAMVHRAANGWIITVAQKECLSGMISHIALCHPEEANKYRTVLQSISAVPDHGRRLHGVNRIKLQTKKYKRRIPQSVTRKCNTQRTQTRKIKTEKERM